ncbi:hypothetical protein HDU67_006716 [Dinochytrium kinnereticum]|nr:hypothetical protein HDU67_006716 [Dinochytrium kinnereticum]
MPTITSSTRCASKVAVGLTQYFPERPPLHPSSHVKKTRRSKKSVFMKANSNDTVIVETAEVAEKRDENFSSSKRGRNVHAEEFVPYISTDDAEGRESDYLVNEGPVYFFPPPLPGRPEMEEIDGQMWPVGYPRHLCPYGPQQVVMPVLDINQNFCYIPRVCYDAYLYSVMAAY